MTLPFQLKNDKPLCDDSALQPYKILSLWELMEAYDISLLFANIMALSNAAHAAHATRMEGPFIIPVQNHETMKKQIDFVCAELERIGFPLSLISARNLRVIVHEQAEDHFVGQLLLRGERATKWVAFQPLAVSSFQTYANDLSTRFQDELSTKTVLILPYDKVGYFDGSRTVFSHEMRDGLPSAVYDMDEACKCFAVGRYTACVFHLMRVMEITVQGLATKTGATRKDGSCLDVKNEDWFQVELAISRAIDSMPRGESKEKCAAVLASLSAVRTGWRNPTMHPKATYTEEEAKALIEAVNLFATTFTSLD